MSVKVELGPLREGFLLATTRLLFPLHIELDSNIIVNMITKDSILFDHPSVGIIFYCWKLMEQASSTRLVHIFREPNQCGMRSPIEEAKLCLLFMQIYDSRPAFVSQIVADDALGLSLLERFVRPLSDLIKKKKKRNEREDFLFYFILSFC